MSYNTYDLNSKINYLNSKLIPIVPSPSHVLDVVDTIIVEDGLATGSNTTITPVEVSLTNGTTTDYLSITPNAILIDSITTNASTNITWNNIVQTNGTHSNTTAWDSSSLSDGINTTIIRPDQININDSTNFVIVTPNQISLFDDGINTTTIQANTTNYTNGIDSVNIYPSLIQVNSAGGSAILAGNVLNIQGNLDVDCQVFNTHIDFTSSIGVVANSLTSSNWSGSCSKINTTSDNSTATCYIPFQKTTAGTGSQLYVDDVTGPLTYKPSTGVLTATTFSGNATTASTASVATTVTSTLSSGSSTWYPTFVAGAGSQSILFNSGVGSLSYSGSGVLSCATFSGALNGLASTATTAANVLTVSDNSATTCYIPFIKSVAGASTPLYVDDTTGVLSYIPSTGVLNAPAMTSTTFTGALTGTASNATTAANLNLATSLNLATFTLGTTLSIAGVASTTLKNSNIVFTGTTNTVSILALTLTQINGEYYLGIYNSGTGLLTFNTGLGTNIRTTYSVPYTIPTLTYGLMKINVLTINAVTVYIVSMNQLT